MREDRGEGSTATLNHQAFDSPRTFISFIFENDKWGEGHLEKAGWAKDELAPGELVPVPGLSPRSADCVGPSPPLRVGRGKAVS